MRNLYRTRRTPYGFGFRDVQETALLEEKSRLCQSILKAENFERIMPAMVDFPETFYSAMQDDVFKIRDHLGYDLSLRSDITAQVIKGYANQLEQKQGVRKFFYYGSVFHDVSRNYPADREIYQIGAEHIGGDSSSAIENLAKIAGQIINKVFKMETVIAIGNVKIMKVLESFTGTPIEKNVLMRRDAPSLANVLMQSGELGKKQAHALARQLLYVPHSEKDVWASWGELFMQLPSKFASDLKQAMNEPAIITQSLIKEGFNAVLEPLLYRDSSYYTGTIFSAFVKGLSQSPVRGGVYDELVSRYSNKNMPACGFAADISTLVRLCAP